MSKELEKLWRKLSFMAEEYQSSKRDRKKLCYYEDNDP